MILTKTAKLLTMLFTPIALISAENDGGFGKKAYKWDAPNGKFSVRAAQKPGDCEFDVEIFPFDSPSAFLSIRAKARLIRAVWSPDSKMVAIEQNKSSHDSAVSLFFIAPKATKALCLPKECGDDGVAAFEAPTRTHARKAAPLKFHFTSEGLQIVDWTSPDEIVLSVSGMGWWGGEVSQKEDTRFLAEYELTVRFAVDGTSSLRKLALKKYEQL